jgi:RNA:NAD 2'-phosphotransferase (TPT1/KptA family)
MILYHVTEEDKLKSILENGLEPMKNELRPKA